MGGRLVLGASTVALVMVASGGTAVLVTHGAKQLQPPQAVAPSLPLTPRPAPTPLVVPRAPGSALFGPSRPVVQPVARPVTLAPPAVAGPVVVTPPLVVLPPEVDVPTVQPPVVEPPAAEPPAVERPVVRTPQDKPARPEHGKSARHTGAKTNNGHHYGQLKHQKG